jgi:hypothetical protein
MPSAIIMKPGTDVRWEGSEEELGEVNSVTSALTDPDAICQNIEPTSGNKERISDRPRFMAEILLHE